MDFYDILDQVIALLKQRGRASYRALQRQFALDAAYLEDLKVEIIKVQQLAVDQDGEILIWIGEAETQPLPTPKPPLQQESSLAEHAIPGAVPRTAPQTPEAERRQLTVMFCDLIESTQLSSRLDPEEYRDLVRAYQKTCTEVIERFDGHVAQLLGDGLLVYFGYPHAHEDDAQRAVRTGLGILDAMSELNSRLQQVHGIHLAIRIGVHTGLVVIGDMGGAGRQEHLALGEVPNIASRIEGLAAPNTIAVSAATYRLVQGYFACQDLGAHALRGVTASMHIYHVLGESGATSRLEVAQPRGFTPLVGRESEVTLLRERWEQAKSGQGQVVILTGEAGIGKSRLVQMLKDHVANEPHVRWECRSAEYNQNTPLFPLTDAFQRLLRFQAEETPEEKVGKLEQTLSQYRLPVEESVPLFAPLLALPIPENHYPPLHLSPQRMRQRTLEAIVAILQEDAERHPVLFIVEDLHWTDPTTLEWLNLLIDQIPTASLLVLLTCRPYFQPAWHHRSYLTEITVNRLSHAQVEQFVNRMTDGKTLPHEVLAQIVEKTDGVPLFVEEITKAILESGQLTAINGHYELTGSFSTFAIPATLQDSLMARLDRLSSAKGIAQLAAVIGRQFAYDLLHAVSPFDVATLQRELGRLVEAELLYQRGLPPQVIYIFKHALIQDTAYQSLLRSTRQQYHQHIAQVLAVQFSEIAESQPELLAHHYTEAGLVEPAVLSWLRAGQRAVQRSANVEAIRHFTQGLDILRHCPATPEYIQHELSLQLAISVPLRMLQGHTAPEVAQLQRRAYALCQQVGDSPQRFSALVGLWGLSLDQAQYHMARELGEQCFALAQRLHDPMFLQEAHLTLGATLVYPWELVEAHTHIEHAIVLYDPHTSHSLALGRSADSGVMSLAYASRMLWLLGYPEQALTRINEACTLAQELSHAYSLGFAWQFAATLHQSRREPQRVREYAEAAMAFAEERGFVRWSAASLMNRGWALVEQGLAADGVAQIQQGLGIWRSMGGGLGLPYYLAGLAEAYKLAGQAAAGLQVVAEALALVQKNAERYFEAELYRLQGDLLLALALTEDQGHSPRTAEAEACFQQAIEIAQQQQAKSLELRAATSLARLWQQQGKRQEACDLLAPVYHWFTEGFDTADLQDARSLLDALA
jgi:class 3 adenylate cyclase/predicted ATPase